MGHMRALDLLPAATAALVRSVDALDEPAFAAPSRLPDWSRAHVVAHLALNAEGLARVVEGRLRGEDLAQYDSDRARDDDIAELAGADASTLRDRLMASARALADALAAMAPDDWEAEGSRTPGGHTFPLRQVPVKRLSEVAFHHVDLGTGVEREDWSDDVAPLLLDTLAPRLRSRSLRLHAPDVPRTWGEESASQTVTGASRDLAWWLSGRGDGTGLAVDSGELPRMPGW